jgi:predicted RNase H-like nuclease
VFVDPNARLAPRFRRLAAFADVLAAPENPCVVAVDIPIGLPARVCAGGRGPEAAVRKHLGPRQSSVFSIPSRKAVYAPDYRTACEIALATSDPPRKVSKQGYMLFDKIREVDRVMTARLCERVFEVHPELAFWRLNRGVPMQTPKKIKSRVNPGGLAERRGLLERLGFDADFLETPLPPGAAADDFIDACANALIAVRLAQGLAEPFPADPATYDRGLTIAIWA